MSASSARSNLIIAPTRQPVVTLDGTTEEQRDLGTLDGVLEVLISSIATDPGRQRSLETALAAKRSEPP